MALTNLYRYRIWCSDITQYKYVWRQIEPTIGPESELIDTSKTSILQTINAYYVTTSVYNYRKYHLIADTVSSDILVNLKLVARVNWDIVISKVSSNNILTIRVADGDTINSSVDDVVVTSQQTIILRNDGINNWSVIVDDYTNMTVVDNSLEQQAATKGDILVDNGVDLVPLSVGNNNYYLRANSIDDVGVSWTDLSNQEMILTNKTFVDVSTKISNSDQTKQVQFDVSNLEIAASQTWAFPNVSDEFVGTTATQILSNKTMGDNLNLAGYNITNLATPQNNSDAVNKMYVDAIISGLSVKASVRIATTIDIDLLECYQDNLIIDGIQIKDGYRVLVKNQTDQIQNGIYVVGLTGPPVRSNDMANDSLASGTFVFVEQGTTNADSGWVCTSDSPNNVVNIDNINFFQFTGTGQITPGDGIVKQANTLSVDIDTNGFMFNSAKLALNVKANGGLVYESNQLALNLEALDITGSLAVTNGGTGKTSLDINRFLVGTGTDPVETTKVVPDGIVVGTSDVQTLTNKTLTAPEIDLITNISGILNINATGTITIPNSTDTLVGRDTTDTLTNKTLTAPIISTLVNGSGTLTLPTITDTILGRDTIDTLTNKTLSAPIISTIVNGGTLVLPSSNTTLVGHDTVDTLTNKTIGDNLNMGGNKITNLQIPTNANDAVNKNYVDSVANGLNVKTSVRIATTTSLTLSECYNGAIVDSVVINTGDRVLIKDQIDATQNGIYVINGDLIAPSRSDDFLLGFNVAGTFFFVEEGTINSDSGWVCVNDKPNDIVETNELLFTQFSGTGQITAGNGLNKLGNTLNVDLKSNGGLVIESSQLALNVSDTNITGILAVSNGGTGRDTLTSNYFLIGDGPNAVTLDKVAPSGTVVGTSDAQILTNKTISANDNTISDLTPALVQLGNVQNTKVNLTATQAPTNTDDTSAGYSIGSTWINVSDNDVYKCTDSTDNFAIWRHLNHIYNPCDNIAICKGNDSYYSVKSSVYVCTRTFIFRGTNYATPTNIKAILKIDNVLTEAQIKIVDVTNNNNILIQTGMGTANVTTIEDLGVLSNLSTDQAIWEIQLSGNNALNYVYLYNIAIYY